MCKDNFYKISLKPKATTSSTLLCLFYSQAQTSKAWIKRGWESTRVVRREFARVFPQLSLLGQTSSESRVDQSLFSISLFLLVASTLLFLRFLTLVKLHADSPSHYSNCHLSMIRNNIFFSSSSFFLWVMTWTSLASGATLMTGQTSQTSHRLSSKFEPAQSWWECMRVDESWRSNESESCDSHPLSSSFDQALTRTFTFISKCVVSNKKKEPWENYSFPNSKKVHSVSLHI